MDVVDKLKTAWRNEFHVDLPTEIISKVECRTQTGVGKSWIDTLSTVRDQTSESIKDLKQKIKQEEFFHSFLTTEIDNLRKQSDVMSFVEENPDSLYAKVNKPLKNKQSDSRDMNSSRASNGDSGKAIAPATPGYAIDSGYEDIKVEVIDREDEVPEKRPGPHSIAKEPRRSVKDKIKVFERSSVPDTPEDGGDYETIVFKPLPPQKPSPASKRRQQMNEYEEIVIPVSTIPKVVVIENNDEVFKPAETNGQTKQPSDTNSPVTDNSEQVSERKIPIKPPKPLRHSKGKEECETLIKSEITSPQFSESGPQMSNSLKKQHHVNLDTMQDEKVIKVDKKIDSDSDDEGDYCTLKDISQSASDKHVSVVRVQSGGSDKNNSNIGENDRGSKKNVTVLSVNHSDRELSRSTENLSTLTIKSTTISKSLEDLTRTDNNQEQSGNGKLNVSEDMKKLFALREPRGGVNSGIPDDADDNIACKSFKSISNSGSDEDQERLNTVTVDITSLLTPEEMEQAKAACASPAMAKRAKHRKVPDYEKWNFHSLLTQPGISLTEHEHLTDTGSEDDMYDNVQTGKHDILSGQSDDSGWSETTTPEEKSKSDDSVVNKINLEVSEHKDSIKSTSTEGSRFSSASCVTVDGDPVFLQRCDSIDGQMVPSPLPDRKVSDEDNFSICSNDDVLDKNDFEETLTEESVNRYKSEQLRMRHLVVKGILESEKAYLLVIDQLCKTILMRDHIKGFCEVIKENMLKAKHYLQSVAMKPGSGMALEDVTTIFYKLDDIYKVHKEFVDDLDAKVHNWTDDHNVASAFKLLVFYFKVYEEYVNNYQDAVETIRKYQENEDTRHLLEEQMEAFKDDALRLEEILLKPVQRIQTNNLVLHDLIKHTPENHPDFADLQKALKLSEENLKTYNTTQSAISRINAPEARHLVKSGFLVEVLKDKKQTRQLRYVFLFNDLVICTKHKGGGRHKEVSFKYIWSMPVASLHIHVKGEGKYELKESLEDLKCKIGNLKVELRDEMLKADSVKDKAFYLTQKKTARNVEKLKKKVQEQEAMLVEALPRLPLNLEASACKSRTFLFPTDYERAEWREATETLINKYRGQTPVQASNHDCETLIDSTKLHMQVNGIGTVLLKKDEEMLNGSLNVTIHKMQGLEATCDVYCCIEMDSYGHFYKKAGTRVCRYFNDASWDEDFELELDGSQTLRILCYKKQPDDEDDLIIGKCALELSLTWLNSKFNEKTISMNDLSITISIRHTPASRTLKRTQSKLRSGVFGVKIATITKRESKTVPSIVATCVQQVEARGLNEVGIYRVSGVTSDVQNLKKIFDKNPVMAGNHAENADIHAVTGVLKLFFRELPEPLFTEQHYQSFVQTIQLQNQESKEKCLLELLHSLPEANYYTIVYIIEHLVRVSTFSVENKMSISNLATIFGPTLLHPAVKDSNIDPTILMVKAARDASVQSEILHFLIKLAASGKSIRKSATSGSSSATGLVASSSL